MLEVSNLRAGYGPVQILHDIGMSIEAGEIVAVLGSNGVGKTTLNNTLSGIVKARAGRIVFNGEDITGRAPKDIVARGLAHVPEGRKIFPNLSVRENLELGAFRRAGANRAKNFERMLSIFPRLRERLPQRAGTLSGGEQQMLAIGRGLMCEPKLLLLDEPSLGLSPLMVEEMFGLIGRLNTEGLAVLLVEQNVVQSLAISSRTYVLEQGRFAIVGRSTDILADPALRKTYLGL